MGKSTYKLHRVCSKCGKDIFDKNKSGLCFECFQKFGRLGENNPFFGKHHSKNTISILKEKCTIASKKMWEDDEYRKKVIENATGKKRNEDFKETQRKNALIQFTDQSQRDLRSEKMKETWQKGNIAYTQQPSINISKQEKEFIHMLNESLKESGIFVTHTTLHYTNPITKRKKYLYPDGLILDKKIAIEYNGSFWHADPKIYKKDDIVHHNKIADDIWKNDKEKQKIYEDLGYVCLIVWSADFLKDKQKIVSDVSKKILDLYKK